MSITIFFDADTRGAGPYYSKGDIVEHPDGQGGLWLVISVSISATTRRGKATLQEVDSSEEHRTAALRWNPVLHGWRH